jgi:hypothetical protein
MKLSIDLSVEPQQCRMIITIRHKDVSILRAHYRHHYPDSKRASLEELEMKLTDTCLHNAPLELFSDDNIHRGSSLAMSFADRAFLYAQTLMPSTVHEATTNHIYLLRPEELLQFYCELHRVLGEIKNMQAKPS